MTKILSVEQIREAERFTTENIGISSLVLIERASRSVVDDIIKEHPEKVLILCGMGNNGADGFALARILCESEVMTDIVCIGNPDKATDENRKEKEIFENTLKYMHEDMKGNIYDKLSDIPSGYDLYIDAILGVGLSRPLEGEYFEAVSFINSRKAYGKVFALDIPTGLNADSGRVMGLCVNCNRTYTFGCLKTGLFLGEGPNFTGELKLSSAGINNSSVKAEMTLIEKDTVKSLLYRRPRTGNKGTFGKVLVVAGSSDMAGAALMCARGAFSVGAGMVKILTDKVNISPLLQSIPEAMISSYSDMDENELSHEIDWCDTVVIGPGLSKSEKAARLLETVCDICEKPLIIDADGLNLLNEKILAKRKEKGLITVLTPHPGEFSRLFGTVTAERMHQSISFVKECADKEGVILVCKDCNTIISDGSEAVLSAFGNDGLARAGSGDILAGVISGVMYPMLQSGRSAFESVILGVSLHGLGAERATRDSSTYCLSSSMIIAGIQGVFTTLVQN